MKRWQQLLSFYVALCVAFAGVVGTSPVLHVLVEHGGHGHAHSHSGFHTNANAPSEHPHPHPHPHPPPISVPGPQDERVRLLAEKYPQPKLFGMTLTDVYRAIGGWIARAVEPLPEVPAGSNGEGHTHHSLPQTLLSGTVECAADGVALVLAPTAFSFSSQGSSSSFVASEFEAQTASRAPPIQS